MKSNNDSPLFTAVVVAGSKPTEGPSNAENETRL